MDEEDRYLDQLEKLEGRKKFRKIRKAYRGMNYKDFFPRAIKYKTGKGILKLKKVNPIMAAAFAHKLMREATRVGSPKHALESAQIYEKIGKGRKAIPRLLKAIERTTPTSSFYQQLNEGFYEDVRSFIERNVAYEEVEKYLKGDIEESGLEGRVGVFALFIIGGAVLSLGSLTLTGNAVSNLTQTTPGLAGIIFFIAGIVGMFFYLSRK